MNTVKCKYGSDFEDKWFSKYKKKFYDKFTSAITKIVGFQMRKKTET